MSRNAKGIAGRAGLFGVAVAALCAALACGANAGAIAEQAGSAAAFTLLDILLTDTANAILDANDEPATSGGTDDGGADGGGGDGGDGTGDGGGDGGGEPSPGEAAYAANGCAVCHGESAEGGSAPALAGNDELEALQQRFGDGAAHFGNMLTDQEIMDVADWLLSPDGGTGAGGDLTGDAASGEDLFASSTCGACHCADASGGCAAGAPSLIGVDAATLAAFTDGTESHPGGTADFSDQDLADLAAWLAGL